MATRLYLRNVLAANAPTDGEKSTALPVGTAQLQPGANTQNRSLLLTKGSTQTSIALNGLGQSTHQDNYLARFTSLPLSAQTVTAQTWTFALALAETNAAANSQIAPCIYVWRPGTSSVVGFIVDSDTPIGIEWGASEDGIVATVSGASVTAQLGDVVVLEVWRHAATQANTTARIQTVYFDGPTDVVDATTANAASYIETPQNLVFPQTYSELGTAVSSVATPVVTAAALRDDDRTVAATATVGRTDTYSAPSRAQVSWLSFEVPLLGLTFDETARPVAATATVVPAVVVAEANTASLVFSGLDPYALGAAGPPQFDLGGADFTVEAWFKDEDAGGSFNHFERQILCKGHNDWDPNQPFGIDITFNTLTARWRVGYTYAGQSVSLASLGTTWGVWHHVALAYRHSDHLGELYLDGALVSSGTHSEAATDNTANFSLGCQSDSGGNRRSPWAGKLDECRLWSVRRSAAQIAAAYTTQASGSEPGLVACYRANEGTGTAVANRASAGAGPLGLGGGATWSTTDVPALSGVAVLPGETAEFDETARPVAVTSAAVSAPTGGGAPEAAPVTNAARYWTGTITTSTHANDAALDLAGDFTAEAWIRDEHGDYNHGESYILAHGGQGLQWGWWFAVYYRDVVLGVVNDYSPATVHVRLDGTGFGPDDYPDLTYPPLARDTWHHLAASYRHSDRQVKLYVDGVCWKTTTLAVAVVHGSITGALGLGVNPNGGGANWLGGLDEVRLWDGVRTPEQIADAYRRRAAGDEAGLVLCYHLDEAAGSAPFADAASGLDVPQTSTLSLTGTSAPVLYEPVGAVPGPVYDDPPYSLFLPSEGPTGLGPSEPPVEVGVEFRTTVPGTVTGLRFYTDSADASGGYVHLWSRTGELLGTAAIPGGLLGAAGWYEVLFPSPVAVTEYTTYVAGRYTVNSRYGGTNGFFGGTGRVSGPLYAYRNGEELGSGQTGHNGVYVYATGGGLPFNVFGSSNYWTDVLFVPTESGAPPAGGAETQEFSEVARPVAAAGAVTLPVGRTTLKPTPGRGIDAGHALAAACAAYWPLTEGAGATSYEAVAGRTATFGTGMTWVTEAGQPAVALTGVSTGPATGTGLPLGSGPLTVIARYRIAADVPNNFYFRLGSVSATREALHLGDTWSQSTEVRLYSDDFTFAWLNGKQLDRIYEVALTLSAGGAGEVYVDGVSQGTHAFGGPFAGNGAWYLGSAGEFAGGGGLNGRLLHVAVFDEVLTAGQISSFYAAPYALFGPNPDAELVEPALPVAVPVAVVAADAMDTGGITYTETGRPVSVAASLAAPTEHRTLPETARAVALSAAVTLPTQRQTAAETAAVVATGATVSLPAQLLARGEPGRAVAITASPTETERAAWSEAGRPVPLLAAALASDQLVGGGFAYNETGRGLSVLGTVTGAAALVGAAPWAVAVTATVLGAGAVVASASGPLTAMAAVVGAALWLGLEARALAGAAGVGGGEVLLGASPVAVAGTGETGGGSVGVFGAAGSVAAVAVLAAQDTVDAPGDYHESGRAVAAAVAVAVADTAAVTEARLVGAVAGVSADGLLVVAEARAVAALVAVLLEDAPVYRGAAVVAVAATVAGATRLLGVEARSAAAALGVFLPLEPVVGTTRVIVLVGTVALRWRAAGGWPAATDRVTGEAALRVETPDAAAAPTVRLTGSVALLREFDAQVAPAGGGP